MKLRGGGGGHNRRDRQTEEGVSASGKKRHYTPNTLMLTDKQAGINCSLIN